MTELILEFDQTATQNLNELMTHYKVESRADLVKKALAVLKTCSMIEKTEGELIARKGEDETRIIVR